MRAKSARAGAIGRDLSDVCILFDLDGTFVDTAEDLAIAMNHALIEAGRRPVPPSRVRHLVGYGARAMLLKGYAEDGGEAPSSEALDRSMEVFLEFYRAHIADRSRPFPGAVAALDALRARGAKTAICTNKREAPARLLITSLGLADRFEAIVGMDTTGIAKPDPAPVLHCLALAGRTRGVFVGDSDTDIRAARAAGMPVLVATFGYGPIDEIKLAFASFDSFGELPALIDKALVA